MELRTSYDGRIIEVCGKAPSFLNVTERHLVGRFIQPFFNGRREDLFRVLDGAAKGLDAAFDAEIRPRERRTVNVAVRVANDPPDSVRWRISVKPTSFGFDSRAAGARP